MLFRSAWTQLHQLPNPWSEPEITRTATREEFPESESIEFGSLDEEPSASLAEQSDPMLPTQVATREAQVCDLPQTKNLFQSFFEETDTPELAEVCREVIEDSPAMDQAFQALLSDMHLSAIQLAPSEQAFVRADLEKKSIPSPRSLHRDFQSAASQVAEWSGVSVDGDDRDLIVVVEESVWTNPFAMR